MNPATNDAGLPVPQRIRAIVALSFGTALVVTDNGIANVALPTIARSLGKHPSETVALVTVYQTVLLMCVLPFATVGDRIGLRRLYQLGQTVFLLATIGAGLADNFEMLLVARACQAFGVSAALSVGVAQLRHIYPPDRLGRGLALNGMVVAVASGLSATIGGFLVSLGSWRLVFLAAAPFAAMSLLLGRSLPETDSRRTDIDLGGLLLCAATFGLAMATMQSLSSGNGTLGASLLVAAMLVGTLFVRRELQRERPVLPVDLLANRAFTLPVINRFLTFAAAMTFSLALPFTLETSFGWKAAQVGLTLSAFPLAMICTAPIAGYLVDRAPGAALCLIAMLIYIGGVGLTALATHWASVAGAVGGIALCGGAMGLFVTPSGHQIMNAAPKERSASAGATLTTLRLVGSGVGATLTAFILARSDAFGLLSMVCAALLAALSAAISAACLFSKGKEPNSIPQGALPDKPGFRD